MTPRRLVLPVLLAVAALAACGGGSNRPAASVDGSDVSQQDVVDELEAIRANSDYVTARQNTGTEVLGSAEDTFNSAFVAEQLAIRIQYLIVGNEVDRRHLEADDECRSAARDSLVSQFDQLSANGDGDALFSKFPEAYQDYLVDRQADVLLLQGDLSGQPCVSEGTVEAYFNEHRDDFVQACASHILLDTLDEANEIEGLLAGGADFAQLAAERSTDTGSASQGGELPCVTRGQFVAEFDDAVFSQPVGEIGPPVQTQFGFHIIRVNSRETPELSDVRDDVVQVLANQVQQSFASWFTQAVSDATVDVDPRYGTWDATTASIERPAQELPSTTTTTAGA